jgi:hypothetical protein
VRTVRSIFAGDAKFGQCRIDVGGESSELWPSLHAEPECAGRGGGGEESVSGAANLEGRGPEAIQAFGDGLHLRVGLFADEFQGYVQGFCRSPTKIRSECLEATEEALDSVARSSVKVDADEDTHFQVKAAVWQP